MSKIKFDAEDVLKLFSKMEKRINDLECFIQKCCDKIPINVGNGAGLFKKYFNGHWQFKSILAGTNVTVTEQDNTITINSTSEPITCEDINDCLGISEAGQANKFLNEQGDFVTVSGSGFTCADLSSCSTTNLPEGTNLYFTNTRAVSALTGQNISIFNNNAGYITEVTESPNRVAYFDNNGDLKTNANFVYNETSNVFNAALPIPGGFCQLSSGASKIGAGDINSPDAYFQVTPSALSWGIPLLSSDVFLLPYNDGNSGDVLTTDGNGNLTFQTPSSSGGTVTSVAALTLGTTGTDLSSTVANSTTTPVITLNVPTASATNRGALSSTDWSTFNNKQNALGFTPEDVANKQTDLTASATKYPTVNAVNTGLANCPTLISSTTASNSATIDFTLPSGYNSFEVRCIGVIPVTDAVSFWVRVSTDGGSTFASGASDYIYQRYFQNGNTSVPSLSAADSKIIFLGNAIGNGSGRYFNCIIRIWNNESSSQHKNITGEVNTYRSDGIYSLGLVNGVYQSNTAINAIRILLSSGNISSGYFELWGYK